MIKKITAMFAIFTTLHASEMNLIQRLAAIPIDLQNHIYFFMEETDEEFIKRTTTPQKISSNLITSCMPHIAQTTNPNWSIQNISAALNPDHTKIALISAHKEKNYWTVYHTITILDLQEQNKIIAHRPFIYKNDADYLFALSPQATMIATLTKDAIEALTCTYHSILKIEKHEEKEPQDILYLSIPLHLKEISSVAFNKQGTKVIVHGHTISTLETLQQPPYHIFSLQKKSTEAVFPTPAKSKLQKYFRKKLICQSWNRTSCTLSLAQK